jgi:hypothetical protein
MTSKLLVSALLACGLHGACQAPQEAPLLPDDRTGESIRNAQLDQAILRQHTLYAYHFQTGSAALNGLGLRDLDVLAANLRKNSGEINVHRGDAAQALYDARLAAVKDHLVAAGIPAANVAIADGPPGGDGISAERVIGVLKKEAKGGVSLSDGDAGAVGSSSSSSSGSGSSTTGTDPQ